MKKLNKKLGKTLLATSLALGAIGIADLSGLTGTTENASAATVSGYGISINPIKDNFYLNEDEMAEMSFINHGSESYMLTKQTQVYKDGKWTYHDSTLYNMSLGSYEKVSLGTTMPLWGKQSGSITKAGKYRYRIGVYTGLNQTGLLGHLYSSSFNVKATR